jgi:chromosome segregation ATPase
LIKESVFLNRSLFEEAERHYSLRKHATDAASSGCSSLTQEVSKIRDQIRSSLNDAESIEVSELVKRLNSVEDENKQLKSLLQKLESRLAKLEVGGGAKPAAAAPAASKKADDDDIDLFGESDEEDKAEKERIKEERVKAYSEKKAKSKKSRPICVVKVD